MHDRKSQCTAACRPTARKTTKKKRGTTCLLLLNSRCASQPVHKHDGEINVQLAYRAVPCLRPSNALKTTVHMRPYTSRCNVMWPDTPVCEPCCGHSACTDFPPYATICNHMHLDAMLCGQISEYVRPAASTVRALTFRLCGHMRPYVATCNWMQCYAAR